MYQIHTQQSQSQSPTKTQYGKCFKCDKPGHWAKDCPEYTSNRSPILSNRSDPDYPSIHCRCGAGLCEIRVSGSCNNPGRKYYRCPGKYGKNCGNFMWCDKPRKEEIPELQPKSFPICGCGAGVSTLLTEEYGPNAGRRYFGCHVKKGEGACNFKQWLDDAPQSSLADDTLAEQINKLDEFVSSDGATQIDALQQSACELLSEDVQVQVQMEAHELPTLEDLEQMDGEEDKSSSEAHETYEASTEVHPPSAINISANTLHSELTNQNVILQMRTEDVQVQVQMEAHELPTLEDLEQMDGEEDKSSNEAHGTYEASTEVHPPSAINISANTLHSELTNQNVILQMRTDDSTSTENVQAPVTTLVAKLTDPLSQDLLLKCLIPYLHQHSGQPDKITNPSVNIAISAVTSYLANWNRPFSDKDPYMLDRKNAHVEGFSPGLDDRPRTRPCLNPSSLLKDQSDEGSIMNGTILQEFEKLAHRLQNELITLLESMDSHNHKIMMKEAKCTFAALDCLQVDYGRFQVRVAEYITQAAALAQVEQTINDDDASSQEVLQRYKNEKSRFDEISRAYCEAKAAFVGSSERLNLLRENAFCLKGLLDEMEIEPSSCEAENAAHEESFRRIDKTFSECKERLQIVYQEAAEAKKISEKHEIERSAAKAAFEKARAQLRE